MAENQVLHKAIKAIREQRESRATRVVAGGCTVDEYKYLCGEIHGLDLAEDHIKAVLKEDEGNDDE